jgi:aryl-alcohol dehydrogenase-like predicted oxidoreductase
MSQLLKNVIPKTGRQVTKLGFGSYRVSKPIHAQSLTAALEGGVNIIDTGNNFENGIHIYFIYSSFNKNNDNFEMIRW